MSKFRAAAGALGLILLVVGIGVFVTGGRTPVCEGHTMHRGDTCYQFTYDEVRDMQTHSRIPGVVLMVIGGAGVFIAGRLLRPNQYRQQPFLDYERPLQPAMDPGSEYARHIANVATRAPVRPPPGFGSPPPPPNPAEITHQL